MANQLARALRKRMTDAERLLWRHLRNRELGGWKFKRQYPVGPFIVDFICLEKNVVIEVDGGQHAENEEKDVQRSAYLNKMGYRVFRFWNNEVLQETEAVLTAIFDILANGKQNSPSPPPLPHRGRGGCYDWLSNIEL
jgi:adenine-specific DNA-methyltransferase